MKRIIRDRKVTPDEAAKNAAIRSQIQAELPELIARHHARLAQREEYLRDVLAQLRASREQLGLSLADITEKTGMDRSALPKLETGLRENPTVDTLARYAEAVGKKLVVSLVDA